MGGYFVNFFNRFGRQWQVYVEAEGDYRAKAENLGLFYVRNTRGESVPLSALTRIEHRTGSEFLMRYNEYRCAQINGSAAPGYSSSQANRALEEVFAQTMPSKMGFDYLGMSFQEQKAAHGQHRQARAARDEAALRYQSTVLNALGELSNALVAREKYAQTRVQQARAV